MTLEVHNLYTGYDGKDVVQDVSLNIPIGRITMLDRPQRLRKIHAVIGDGGNPSGTKGRNSVKRGILKG